MDLSEAFIKASEIHTSNNDSHTAESIELLRQCVALNDSDSQILLGIAYYKGDFVEKDVGQAISYLTLAAEQGHESAISLLAQIYYNGIDGNRDYAKAVKWFQELIKFQPDNEEAHLVIGACYAHGRGVNCDGQTALLHLNKAWGLGNKDAAFKISYIYSELPEFKNDDEYTRWLTIAAENGHSVAQYVLGVTLYKGAHGLSEDKEQAYKYIKLSAENNNGSALTMLLNNRIWKFNLDLDLDHIVQKCIDFAKDPTNSDVSEMQYELGDFYSDDMSGKADAKLSAYWFKKAIESGHSKAALKIGKHYLYGWSGYPRDEELAIRYLTIAADQGNADAMYRLSDLFRSRNIVNPEMRNPKDAQLALEWLINVSETGHGYASFCLYQLYISGAFSSLKVTPDENMAFHYLETAAQQEEELSYFPLFDSFYFGKGTTQDYDKASEVVHRAATILDLEDNKANFFYRYGLLSEVGKGGFNNNTEDATMWFYMSADIGNKESVEALRRLNRLAYCDQCGKIMPPDGVCPTCSVNSTEPPAISSVPLTITKKRRNSKILPVAGIAIVVLVIFLIGGQIFGGKSRAVPSITTRSTVTSSTGTTKSTGTTARVTTTVTSAITTKTTTAVTTPSQTSSTRTTQQTSISTTVYKLMVPTNQVEDEVLRIRDIWNKSRENIETGKCTKRQIEAGIVSYSTSSGVETIEVTAGTKDKYSRIYTYENERLVFAYYSADGEGNRLYFKNDQLIRWRYTPPGKEAINFDNARNNNQFLNWESQAIAESNQYLSLAKKR